MGPENRYIIINLFLYSKGYISYFYKRLLHKYYNLKEDFFVYSKQYSFFTNDDEPNCILEDSIKGGYKNIYTEKKDKDEDKYEDKDEDKYEDKDGDKDEDNLIDDIIYYDNLNDGDNLLHEDKDGDKDGDNLKDDKLHNKLIDKLNIFDLDIF